MQSLLWVKDGCHTTPLLHTIATGFGYVPLDKHVDGAGTTSATICLTHGRVGRGIQLPPVLLTPILPVLTVLG